MHPSLYDAVMWLPERLVLRRWRARLGAAAGRRVVELGAGSGAQLPWYVAGAEVVLVEPDAAMAARAARRVGRRAGRAWVVVAPAESLPLPDAAADAVVATFALCSVADPRRALAEAWRVLRPGGVLLLLEHVHVRWQPGRALLTLAAPLWARLAGGCRLDQDTVRFVSEAGFTGLRVRSHLGGWVVEVEARRPSGLHGAG